MIVVVEKTVAPVFGGTLAAGAFGEAAGHFCEDGGTCWGTRDGGGEEEKEGVADWEFGGGGLRGNGVEDKE